MMYNIKVFIHERNIRMKKTLLRSAALLLACLLLLCAVSCGKQGKTLMTLKKDGVKVTLSVNLYQLMLTRMKGDLTVYGNQLNGVNASQDAYWSYQDKFDGTNLQTIDEYYCNLILDNCRTYLATLYLFEKEGLSLSAADEEEIEKRLEELVNTDGDGSKTKLNAVLAAYGVNYDILREAYTMEKKLDVLQKHLYGENASKVGDVMKTEFMNENYVHFRQIFLAGYAYVYETDKNDDVIYYLTEGENKGHIAYDTENGVTGKNGDGSVIVDKNGDAVYFVNDGSFTKIAYNPTEGEPVHATDENGVYKTTTLTEDELKALAERAQKLYDEVKDDSAAEFEAAAQKESDDTTDKSEYSDGIYLQKDLDYAASSGTAHLGEIVTKLDTMEVGEVAMVKSTSGYHIIMKYANTEKAYEKEANETWFANFNTNLITSLFLDECEKLYADIKIDEAVLAEAPTMKEVNINYYY